MTDWKSIKKAADTLPSVRVAPLSNMVPKPMDNGFYSSLVEYGPNEKPLSSDALRASSMTAVNHPFRNVSRTYAGVPGHQGAYFPVMKRSDIRPALYGKRKGWETEQQWAMDNRWRRLMSLAATPQDRANLEARRAAGQMPPIVMHGAGNGKTLNIDDSWFSRPGEYVQATVVPGGSKSMSWPARNKFVVSAPQDWDLVRLFREEAAHNATPTITGDGVESVLGGAVPGGDKGYAAAKNGLIGSYELNPGEMTRMALLAKAAAHRLGYGAIRSVDDLETFLRQGKWKAWNGADNPVSGNADYPFDPRHKGVLDFSTRSDSLLKTIDSLKWYSERDPDPERRKAFKAKYDDLRLSLQDAVEMARYGRRDGNTMNA